MFVLLDDVGFSDLGPYGSEIATPNIDALAADGIRYNRFETRAICSPTRAALLTGRNNQSVGMLDLPGHTANNDGPAHSRGYIVPEAATVAQILRANGYRTSATGKWHLTPEDQQDDSYPSREHWPSGKGFDNFYGWLTGWTDQWNPSGRGMEWKAVAIHQNGTDFSEDDWELYHVAADFSESIDVAEENPEKLEQLVALWWSEAEKYGALPLTEFSLRRSTAASGDP